MRVDSPGHTGLFETGHTYISIYFGLHCSYIFNRGVGASKANLLKKALV